MTLYQAYKDFLMAKIHEEVILIRLSRLVKDDADVEPVVTAELINTLSTVAEELLGGLVVVEGEVAK
jgi:hypothetical protein